MIRIIAVTAVLFLYSCEEEKNESTSEVEATIENTKKHEERTEKIENIIYNIPSPTETVSILKRAGAKYVFDFPNDPLNVDNYQTTAQKGLNMGVYGADLTYATVFNKTTETSFYLTCVTKMGRKLNVENVFTENVNERIQDNVDNRDSMQVIINETFWELDAYLKEQERENVSALIIVGGWVESLYIATQFSKLNPENNEMKQRIAEQKYSLKNLIGLVKGYESKSGMEEVFNTLDELKSIFDEIIETKEKASSENNSDVIMIGNKITLEMSDELLKKIIANVEEIRNEIVN